MENLVEKYSDILDSEKYLPLGESEKIVTATVIDNIEKEIQNLSERTGTGDISTFTPILIPVVRRVMPALVANNIAGIQPLKTPTGYIYGLNYRYTGDGNNSISPANKAQIVEVDAADAVGDTITGATSGATGVVRYVEGKTELVELTGAAKFIAGEDLSGGTSTKAVAVYSNQAQFKKILKNYAGPYSTAAGEALAMDMREVGLTIERKSVEAVTRKLKAAMTIEMLQDMKALYGMNAMNELMSILSAELKLEIDRAVIDFANGVYTPKADYAIMAANTPTAARWEVEYYRLLAIKIAAEAREIGRNVKLGSANTIVATPKVITALSQLDSFNDAPLTGGSKLPVDNFQGVIGTLDNRYKIVADNFSDDEYVTISYVGSDARACGVIYSPYNASLIKTVNQENGQNQVIMVDRSAISSAPLNPELFGSTFNVTFDNSFAL